MVRAQLSTENSKLRTIPIGLVQQRWHPDPAGHAAALRRGVLAAAAQGARLICLQELTLHRYFGDAMDKALFTLAEPVSGGPTGALCGALAREAGVFVVGSLFERGEPLKRARRTGIPHFYNTAVIYDPQGQLAGFTRKQHIPRGTGYEETFYFEPGDSDYPVHDLGFIRLAVPTCYDQWFPEMARICALKGADLIVYPTAIGSEPDHPKFDSQPRWRAMMVAHAIANGVFVAAVNRTGQENLVRFYGSSFVCDPTGVILAQAPRNRPAVIVADLDFSIMAFWRRLFPLLKQRHPATYRRILMS
jgi:N-carbamoylputrescine amidase